MPITTTLQSHIVFDEITVEFVKDGNTFKAISEDFHGFFYRGRNAHFMGDNPTWRQLSAYCLAAADGPNAGNHKNTLTELKRLNSFGSPDDIISASFSSIYLWEWSYVQSGSDNCCCDEEVTVTTFAKLRLNQRNDGKGVGAFPRLRASVGGSTAKGDAATSRVGNNNRLDGAKDIKIVTNPGGPL